MARQTTAEQAIAKAAREAAKSLCRYRVGAAVLDDKGQILGVGYNRSRFVKKGGGVHAEISALRHCPRDNITAIVIVRVGRDGSLKPIDPCPSCQKLLDKLDVKVRKTG